MVKKYIEKNIFNAHMLCVPVACGFYKISNCDEMIDDGKIKKANISNRFTSQN